MTSAPERERQGIEIAGRYQQAVYDLAAIVTQTPSIAFDGDRPTVDAESAQERVAEIAKHFVDSKPEP